MGNITSEGLMRLKNTLQMIENNIENGIYSRDFLHGFDLALSILQIDLNEVLTQGE